MTHHEATEATGRQADPLTHEANLAAYFARRFAEAARRGDLVAARRWKRAYQRSTVSCRRLGDHARRGATDAVDPR